MENLWNALKKKHEFGSLVIELSRNMVKKFSPFNGESSLKPTITMVENFFEVDLHESILLL